MAAPCRIPAFATQEAALAALPPERRHELNVWCCPSGHGWHVVAAVKPHPARRVARFSATRRW